MSKKFSQEEGRISMKKYQIIRVISLSSILLLTFNLSHAHDSTYYKHMNADITVVRESPLTELITIEYDENFTDYGFPGNGSKENPYRIENYSINALEYHNGIVIINTTKHFIIQNCNLMAFFSAIYIENVSDGTAVIRENTLLKSDFGLVVMNSNGVQIINNICGPYNEYGIFLPRTSNSLVKQNTGFQNIYNAIRSVKSVSNIYMDNNCSNNFNTGITLEKDSNASAINNICNNNLRGGIFKVTNSTIKGNRFDNNYHYGSLLTTIKSSTVSYNLFCFNAEYGCLAEDVDNSTFIGNYFENNTLYGLLLDEYSSNNLVYHNSFIGNKPDGTSQARDNGEVVINGTDKNSKKAIIGLSGSKANLILLMGQLNLSISIL